MEHELIDRLARDATPVRPLALPSKRLARWTVGDGTLSRGQRRVGRGPARSGRVDADDVVPRAGRPAARDGAPLGGRGACGRRARRHLVPHGAVAAVDRRGDLGGVARCRHRCPTPGSRACGGRRRRLTARWTSPCSGSSRASSIWSLVRRAAPLRPGWTGLLATLTAASVGALGTHLVCPNGDAAHLLVWHFVPVALLAAAGIQLGRRLLHWPLQPLPPTSAPHL